MSFNFGNIVNKICHCIAESFGDNTIDNIINEMRTMSVDILLLMHVF